MSNPLRPLADVLGPRIADLEERARAANRLTARVRAALPEPEKNHVLAAAYKADDLIVLADAAVWCSRIRYAETALRTALKAAGEREFARLKIRVGLSSLLQS